MNKYDFKIAELYKACLKQEMRLNELDEIEKMQLIHLAEQKKTDAMYQIDILMMRNPQQNFEYFADRHSGLKDAVKIINWLSNKPIKQDRSDLLEAYKILIDDYKPMVAEIEKELAKYDSKKDKIKFLKSKEIDYLINITLNPNMMAASGIVTYNNPHKAGLDRWISLQIEKLTNDFNSSAVAKQIKTSYKWQGNPNELPELYNLMTVKYKLISLETTYEQFEAVFTGQPITNIKPIKWMGSNRLLAYFLDTAFNGLNWQSIAGHGGLFLNTNGKLINANDLSVAKKGYTDFGKSKAYEKVDLILKNIKKHS